MIELPKGWSLTKIANVIGRFKSIDPAKTPNNEFRYIDIGTIDNTSQTIGLPKHFCGRDAPSRARRLVETGDVLFSTVRTYLKNIAIVPIGFEGVLTSTGIAVLRPSACIDGRFLFEWVRSDDFVSEISRSQDGTMYPAVSDNDIANASIPVPPLSEQRRIVAKLEALLERTKAARDELAAIPISIEHYKQAILEKAFTGELTADWRLQNFCAPTLKKKDYDREAQSARTALRGSRRALSELNDPSDIVGSIPSDWHYGRLIDLIELKVGFAFKSSWYQKEGVPLLRGINVAPGRLDWEEIVSLSSNKLTEFAEYTIVEGDILLAMDRPLISSGLKVAVANGPQLPALLVQRVARMRPTKWADAGYIWWLLNSPLFLRHAIARSTGSDLPHISGNDIGLTPVPVPPIEEQREIARLLNEGIGSINKAFSESEKVKGMLDHLDQRLRTKAFSGELVAQDPNDEPAKEMLERILASRIEESKARPSRKNNTVL
jgi:type I restriction enzyme, S subunit